MVTAMIITIRSRSVPRRPGILPSVPCSRGESLRPWHSEPQQPRAVAAERRRLQCGHQLGRERCCTEPSDRVGQHGGACLHPRSPNTLTRPLCPYPQTAVYNGSGSVTDAANWHCGGDLEKNVPVGTPLSGAPGQPVPCYDVLAKYKHEVNGPLDYQGSGVDPDTCHDRPDHD